MLLYARLQKPAPLLRACYSTLCTVYVLLQAGLEVVAAQLQPGMPRGLFAVRMFALRPLA